MIPVDMSVFYSSMLRTAGRIQKTVGDKHRIGVCSSDTLEVMPLMVVPGTIVFRKSCKEGFAAYILCCV